MLSRDLRFCVIKNYCTRSSARSLRSLRNLRENIKRGAELQNRRAALSFFLFDKFLRTVPIAQGQTKKGYNNW